MDKFKKAAQLYFHNIFSLFAPLWNILLGANLCPGEYKLELLENKNLDAFPVTAQSTGKLEEAR